MHTTTAALIGEIEAELHAELDDITRLLDAFGDGPALVRMQARIVGLLAAISEETS